MATRTAFKFFASFGPAGSLVTIAEKASRAIWYDAYEQGNPDDVSMERIEKEAQEKRQDYVQELFKIRGRLEREMVSFKPDVKDAAY